MTPHIAIATAPPHVAAETESGTRPGTGDDQFDATLRQSRSDKDAHSPAQAATPDADTHGASHAAASDGHTPEKSSANPHVAGKSDHDHDHDHKHDRDDRQPVASPIATPAAVPAAGVAAGGTRRQVAAAAGKGVPANAPPTAVTTIVSAKPAGAAGTVDARRVGPDFSPTGALRHGDAANSQAPPSTSLTSAAASSGASEPTLLQAVLPQANLRRAAGDKDGGITGLNAQAGNPVGLLVGHVPAHGTAPGSQVPTQLTMQAAPGQPQFVQQTSQHVAWLVGNHIQKAEIQLNPRALGPIRIAISTRHDHVDVSFAVHNPQTVQALQQTLPQLAEMLAQQGLNLGQASVGQQAPGQQHAPPAVYPDSRWRNADIDVPVQASRIRHVQLGRVDEFA